MTEMECRTCEHLVDQFGNYVMCKLLHRFVDYEYWHGKCPNDCPIERERKKMPRLIDANRIVYSWTIDNDGEEHDGVTLQSIIKKMPTIDAEPVVHGHWEWDEDGMDWNIGAWKCSECRSTAEAWWAGAKNVNPYHCSGHRYCSNCGAKMDESSKTE